MPLSKYFPLAQCDLCGGLAGVEFISSSTKLNSLVTYGTIFGLISPHNCHISIYTIRGVVEDSTSWCGNGRGLVKGEGERMLSINIDSCIT